MSLLVEMSNFSESIPPPLKEYDKPQIAWRISYEDSKVLKNIHKDDDEKTTKKIESNKLKKMATNYWSIKNVLRLSLDDF